MTPLPDMDKLQDWVHTTEERQAFLEKIEKAQALLFSPNAKPLGEVFPELESLVSGTPDVGKALVELRNQVLALPIIHLTMAFEPTKEQVEKIAGVIQSSKKDSAFILEIELDPTIIAGVAMSDSGVIIDRTLKQKIEGVLLQPILAKYIPFFA